MALINDQSDNRLPEIRGERLRQQYQQAVVALCGRDAPPVVSKGSRFYNVDRWTGRVLVKQMCDWAKENPGCMPTMTEIRTWVNKANNEPVPKRHIVVASTPPRLNIRLALAMIGGNYHEGLHTVFTCRRALKPKEVFDFVIPRWAKVPDWSKYHELLQEWNNIIEDIRIERRGIEKFPGITTKMHDLQDFILAQEAKSRMDAIAAGRAELIGTPLAMVSSTFRDIGLGYNTNAQRVALDLYQELNPEAYTLVVDGPIAPYLRESIALTDKDDLGCLRLAMDVIALLSDMADEEQKNNPQSGKGGGVVKCPSCQAPGNKLVVRPLADGNGGQVPGKGVLTCTVCGHQEIVDLSQAPMGQQGEPDPENAIRFENMPQTPGQEPGEGKGGGKGQPGEGKGQKGKGGGSSKGKPEGSGKGKPEGSGKGSGKDGDKDGKGSGKDGDKDGEEEGSGKGEGEGGEGKTGRDHTDGSEGDEDEGEGPGNQGDEWGDSGDDDSGNGAGGHNYEEGAAKGWDVVAEKLLDQAAKGEGSGILDGNSALEGVIEANNDKDDKNVKRGEQPWRPYNPSLDSVRFVDASHRGRDDDQKRSNQLYNSVKKECAYLRSRLRSIVRAVEQRDVFHGSRRGKGLSGRMLVDTSISIKQHQKPSRAYYRVSERVDTSLAAAIVLDESGSMSGALQDATRIMLAISEPLDSLGCATMALGFRDGHGSDYPPNDMDDSGTYHRYNGVCIDVFKAFGERFSTVKWRFANTRATGGTPMADGVQYALDSLNDRKEGHRVLFIVTDGCPNYGHEEVMARQIRLANEAGIHVIGVGLGHGASYVKTVFPDHVWAASLGEIPKLLVKKLNKVMDFRTAKRGRKMKKSA